MEQPLQHPGTVESHNSVRDLEESKLAATRDVDMAERDNGSCVTVLKRKRGRPVKALPKTCPPLRQKKDEEDVCFICFDGGSLVLCDRRGCPKAYHPSCIKRDEAFFRSKAKWNCGWHICSICQKSSHYMCYTCTYSLCKGCTRDADFVCVRENKGLCGMCMRTIMLIENSAQGNKDKCEVDFDDQGSWEYLFKVYWMYLKEKLSLTFDDLIRAKNPWNGAAPMSCRVQTPHELNHLRDEKGSGSENCIDIESNNLKNKKSDRQPQLLSMGDCFNKIASGGDSDISLPECTKWASKELLEFVAHIKNGDTSPLSQFDVQTLLLEYIKKNNLRDPQQKSQIVCDSRLVNLFGKARVGHIEMLHLLESHFLIKDSGPTKINFGAGIIDVAGEGDSIDNSDKQYMLVNDKRCKERKKADVLAVENNPDTYAAIDAHNINLIYMRRSLMENMIEETEKIHEKVVGSFVRIRISSGDKKQDMYRLVQVVGTSKVAEPYNIGTRSTDIKLEILNLNRKEVISIDEISNKEFSEDECKRLRQSIKYGLSKKLTVGEILDKAMTLQEIRVNDLLEAEILRLNHLRDRASEKGHRKELKECVEKLQLLNSTEERRRRLLETPDVHSDPNLDSMSESDEDTWKFDETKQDGHIKPKYSGFDRKERGGIFSRIWEGAFNDGGCKTQDMPSTHEPVENTCITKNYINCNDIAIDDSSNVGVKSEVSSVAVDDLPSVVSTGIEQPFGDDVNDRSWHYLDPTGKVQGPFSLSQLGKWNASGHFPLDLRIWRTDEKQDNSILLADALSGNCSKNMSLPYNSQLLSLGTSVTFDNKDKDKDNSQVGVRNSRNGISTDFRIAELSKEQKADNNSTQSNVKDGSVRSNGWFDQLLSLGTSVTLDNKDNSQDGVGNTTRNEISADFRIMGQNMAQNVDDNSTHSNSKDESGMSNNGWLSQLQLYPPRPLTAFSEKLNENPSDNLREGHGIEGNSNDKANHVSNQQSDGQSNSGQSYRKQSDSEENTEHLSEPNSRHPNVNISSDCLITTTAHVSGTKATPHKLGFDLHSSPSPPACHASTTWQAIIGEPNDFDESVSDLLAEVEAMESLGGGLESPTSIMKCGEELTDGSKHDCLSFAELTPMLDAGKGDALSSTIDLQLPPQSTVTDISLRLADVHHHHERISGVHSSRSAEVEVGTKNVSVSGNRWESSSENSPIVSSTATLGLATDTTWRFGSENTHLGWGGMNQGNANMGPWGVGQTLQENRSSNSYPPVVTTGYGDSQTRYGSDRVSVSRDRGFHGHGRESSFGRGRTAWNRHPLFGVENGGSYRPLPKGQRVCKFYESGYCKKGASCDYLHP